MSDSVSAVSNRVTIVERDIAAHEDLCAERYGNINTAIREIKSIIKWAGTTGLGIIIALIGFLAVQIYNSNEATKQALATKLDSLQQQNADLRAAQPHPAAPAPLP